MSEDQTAPISNDDDPVVLRNSDIKEFKDELAQINRDINALEYRRNLIKLAIQGANAMAELKTLPE